MACYLALGMLYWAEQVAAFLLDAIMNKINPVEKGIRHQSRCHHPSFFIIYENVAVDYSCV